MSEQQLISVDKPSKEIVSVELSVQHFLQKRLDIDNNTSATLIITFFIFILGYIVAGLNNKIARYFSRNSHKRLFLQTLERTNSSLKQRNEVLDEQLKTAESKFAYVIPVTKIQFYQAEILQSIDYKITFESFFSGIRNSLKTPKSNKLRTRAFLKVWENMANIVFWENQMFEAMPKYQNELNEMNEKLITPLTGIWEKYETLFLELENDRLQGTLLSFVTELKHLVEEWRKQENPENAYVTNTHITKPLITLCDQYTKLIESIDMRTSAINADYRFQNMVNLNQGLINDLKSYKTSLTFFRRSTNKILKILSY